MKRAEPLNRIRQQLEARRRQLVESLSDELEELRNECDERSWEDGEEEVDSMSDDVSSGLAERASDELGEIDAALCRLNEGTYGVCAMCGRRIVPQRLKALPFTSTCVECQEICEADFSLVPIRNRRDWRDFNWPQSGSAKGRKRPSSPWNRVRA